MPPVPLFAVLLMPVTAERFQANVVPEVLLVGVYVKAVPLVADAVKALDSCGIAFTVKTAALELAVPALLVHTARYCLVLSLVVTANVNVALVAPAIFAQVVPLPDCHCTVGVGVPPAAEVKLTFSPAHFVCDKGCVDMAGETVIIPALTVTTTF